MERDSQKESIEMHFTSLEIWSVQGIHNDILNEEGSN